MKCFEKISSNQKQEIFKKYWSIGDKFGQWSFILENSKAFDTKSVNNSQNTKVRSCARKYFLKTDISNGNITEVQVCQLMFINTLSISKQTIDTAFLKLKNGSGFLSTDMRGRYRYSSNE